MAKQTLQCVLAHAMCLKGYALHFQHCLLPRLHTLNSLHYRRLFNVSTNMIKFMNTLSCCPKQVPRLNGLRRKNIVFTKRSGSGAYARPSMPCASRLSIAFTRTGGTDSSVARIVMRYIYTVLV